MTLTLSGNSRPGHTVLCTSGGDGSALVLDMDEGAIRDTALNDLSPVIGFPLTEIADTTKPEILSVELQFSDGLVVITADETIDATPSERITQSKIFISNIAGNKELSLGLAEIIETDGLTVTLRMAEADRVSVIKSSGTPGGIYGLILRH